CGAPAGTPRGTRPRRTSMARRSCPINGGSAADQGPREGVDRGDDGAPDAGAQVGACRAGDAVERAAQCGRRSAAGTGQVAPDAGGRARVVAPPHAPRHIPPAPPPPRTAGGLAAGGGPGARRTALVHRSVASDPAPRPASVATSAAADARQAPRSALVAHATQPSPAHAPDGGGAPQARASV